MVIQMELIHLLKKYKSIQLEYNEKQNEVLLEIGKIKIMIAYNYPSSTPNVFIDNIPYKKYINPPTNDTFYLMKTLNIQKKLAMKQYSGNISEKEEDKIRYEIYKYSILHPLNWKPIYTIDTIMKEIETVRKMKETIKNIIMTYEIAEKFNLPFELKHMIYFYL